MSPLKSNDIDLQGRNMSLDKYMRGKYVPGETSKGVIMSLEKFVMG